ncbi:MAG: hypothetical protein CMJ94_02310 [Planctomycetes bacterium]|nr:hypothetical protein [Planctomycetota bacterium]
MLLHGVAVEAVDLEEQAALRTGCGVLQIPFAHLLQEGATTRLHAIQGLLPGAGLRALPGGLDRQIQDDDRVRLLRSDHEFVEREDELRGRLLLPLVGQGRRSEALAQHVAAGSEGGRHLLTQQLASRGEEQQGLGLRGDRVALGVEQQRAQPFADLGAARLAQMDRVPPQAAKPCQELFGLGGLARAVDALDDQKARCHAAILGWRAGNVVVPRGSLRPTMPALRPTSAPATALTVAVLALLPACQSQRPVGPTALEAPVLSPPAHATVEERIQYWEDRMPAMSPIDQAEALLCLGELQLEAGDARQARINFNAARNNGYLSKAEEAQAAWGVGRAYLLEQKPQRAVVHLREASYGLGGPEGEECAYLLAYAEGRPVAAPDARLMARVARFTTFEPAAEYQPRVASGQVSELIDVPRRDWGAQRLLANHDPMEAPFRITVHHTAEPADTHALDSGKREMRDLQRMHQQGNGWADLGYHFLIDQAGRVYEGRPLSAQGAHAGNSELNRGNIGICLIGNFVAQPERGSDYALAQAPTGAQLDKLDNLVAALQSKYGISDSQIWAHSHLKETACPGPALLEWVRERRATR